MDANHDDKLRREADLRGFQPRPVDPEATEKAYGHIRSGGTMVVVGILVLVVSFIVAVALSMPERGQHGSGQAFASGMKAGMSPLFMLCFFSGVALLVLGLVRKANGKRAIEAAFYENRSVAPAMKAPLGDILAPSRLQGDLLLRQSLRSRGGWYLGIGGFIAVASLVGMVVGFKSGHTGESIGRAAERIVISLGLAFIPFAIGLILAIRGAILRSNNKG